MPNRYKLNKLDYNYLAPGEPLPDPNSIRIQASAIAKFFDNTPYWYRTKLLGEPDPFTASTATVLGTCLHWKAECFINEGTFSSNNKKEMLSYLDDHTTADPFIDDHEIKAQLKPMWRELKDFINDDPGGLVEPFVELEMLPGITVGGSIDRLKPVNDTKVYTTLEELSGKTVDIQDWKTTSALNPPTKMSKDYKWQLLVYAYVLQKRYNIRVRNIVDVFITREASGRVSEKTGKPLKDYPSTLAPVVYAVTEEDMDFIENVIKLIAESIDFWNKNPDMRYLLAQDYRLKEFTAPDYSALF